MMRILPSFLLFSIFTISGCMPLEEGTRPYEPLPQWEKGYFDKARRDVYPDDVRRDPQKYRATLVAWTGIIKDIKFKSNKSYQIAVLTMKHHYFDWIEDEGDQQAKFFLSPKGEGDFALAYVGSQAEDSKSFISQFSVGDMIIAYGFPTEIKNSVVGLSPVKNIRSVNPEWFRTDILEYGRPGQPVRYLKTPLF
jgi:hypothetical protein